MSGTVVSAPASALPSTFSDGASAPEPQSSLAALSWRTGRSVSSSNVSADHAAAPAPAPEIPSPAIPAAPASFAPSHAAVSDQPVAVAEPQAPERVAKSVKVSAEPVAAAPAVAPSAPTLCRSSISPWPPTPIPMPVSRPAVVRAVLVAVGERSRSCRRRCRADAIR